MIDTTERIASEPASRADPDSVMGVEIPAVAELVIEPAHGWQLINARELWRYRELLYFLALRDIKVRYKQTALGAAWAILQPFMMMLVFTVFLGRMARVPAGDAPYPLFVFAGLLPWTFFSTAVSSAGNSVVGSERLVTKIYFPRLAIPFASVAAALVDFCVAFLMLVAMMVWYGVRPSAGLLLVPVVASLLLLTAAGMGTLLASLNVSYRDFRYVVPFLMQICMFATPSIYMDTSPNSVPVEPAAHAEMQGGRVQESKAQSPATASATGEQLRDGPSVKTEPTLSGQTRGSGLPPWIKEALKLNPLTGLIRVFRAAVLGGTIDWSDLTYATVVSLAVFFAGCTYFRRVEGGFADVI